MGALFFASIYHALYDILVSYWFMLPGLYFIIKSAYRWMYQLLGYTAAHSPFRKSLSELIHTSGPPEIEPGMECLDCGSQAAKPTYGHGRISIQKCEQCGIYLCSEQTLCQIVHQYGSLFGSLKKKIKPLARARKKIGVLIEANRIDRKKHMACFQLDAFNTALEAMSQRHANQIERKWWFPFKIERET